MRIVDIRERPIAISRYHDPGIASGGLTTSLVAVVTDAIRSGRPVAGYGFSSIGRYAQSGLIRDRFAPRLLRAEATGISTDDGANLDPFRDWSVMMTGAVRKALTRDKPTLIEISIEPGNRRMAW